MVFSGSLVYSEERVPFSGRPVPYAEQDACAHWERHYRNRLYLEFVAGSELASPQERARARYELAICHRKMAHWQRHPNWSVAGVQWRKDRVDREWRR